MPLDPFKKGYKPPVKAKILTRTACKLSVCAYHEGFVSPDSDIIECSHPHKPLHMDQTSCPLYRLDWAKQQKANQKGR